MEYPATKTLETDVLIVGAGIQGLILAYELHKAGISTICLEKDAIGGKQTLQSQFYLHRGHFYKNVDLARTLNLSYSKWSELLNKLKVKPEEAQSFVGFNEIDDEKIWVESWGKAEIPFSRIKKIPSFLNQVKDAVFYTFPHVLFNGKTLIERLYKHLAPIFIYGTPAVITVEKDGFKKIIVQTGSLSRKIRAKNVVFCAGENNLNLIRLIEDRDKVIPNIQMRSCQVLVLKGQLPNMSVLLPGAEIFIAPQYSNDQTYWLYTHGYDPLTMGNENVFDYRRLELQIQALFNFFPEIEKWVEKKASMYTAVKVESADFGQGIRPNKATVHIVMDGVFAVWPTKLALAFESTKEIIHALKNTSKVQYIQMGEQALTKKNKQVILSDYL